MTRGLFIAFEGGEGGGKSTQVELLAGHLRSAGYAVVVTREPGGTPVAESIREFLLDPSNEEMAPRTEALLFAAARAEHVNTTIKPALARGALVLCDRYVDSSIAYQGVGRALGVVDIEELSNWATEALLPDLTVVVDIDPRLGLKRARNIDDPDRIEQLGISFHDAVRTAFLDQARAGGDRYMLVDGAADVASTAQAIAVRVQNLLDAHQLTV